MDTKTLRLIQEAKDYLKALNIKKEIPLTTEQREAMKVYSDMLSIHMRLSCSKNKDGEIDNSLKSAKLLELESRYPEVNLSNIKELEHIALDKLNLVCEGIE